MKEVRLKEGRKVCFTKDNQAEVYKILSVDPAGGIMLIRANSSVIVHHPSKSTHITAKDLHEASPHQLEHAKLT